MSPTNRELAEQIVTAIEGNFRDWLMSDEHAEAVQIVYGVLEGQLVPSLKRERALREACFVFIEARKHNGYGMNDAEEAIRKALNT